MRLAFYNLTSTVKLGGVETCCLRVFAHDSTLARARRRNRSQGSPKLPADYSNTKAVGELLFTEYLLAFEVAGVVLLVAIIAAVALTLRKRTGSRRQNPSAQVRVQRDERVRLVKMDPEPRQGR